MNIPEICGYCGGRVKLTTAQEIHEDSDRSIYLCTNCGAYVGCHRDPRGGLPRPMGKLANYALRSKRIDTHKVFDRLWQERGMTRTQAYKWLAKKLNRPERLAHIGQMDMADCQKVIDICWKAEEEDEGVAA